MARKRLLMTLLVSAGGLALCAGGIMARSDLSASSSPGASYAAHRFGASGGHAGVDGRMGTPKLRVITNGKHNPERIPDAYAYRHLLSVMAPTDGASPKLDMLHDAIMERMRLSAADVERFDGALRRVGLRAQLNRIAREREAFSVAATNKSPTAGMNLNRLMAEERALMQRAREEVVGALSAEGVRLLDEYVQQKTKRQIKVLGGVSHHPLDEGY